MSMYDVKPMPVSPPQTKNLSQQSSSGKESQNCQIWPTFDNQHYLKSQSMTSTYSQPGNFPQYVKPRPYPQETFDKTELPKFPPEVPPPLAFPPGRNMNLKAETMNSPRSADIKPMSSSEREKLLHAGMGPSNHGFQPTEAGDRKSILQPIQVNTHSALGYQSCNTSGQSTPVSHPGNNYQVVEKYASSPVTTAQGICVPPKSLLRAQQDLSQMPPSYPPVLPVDKTQTGRPSAHISQAFRQKNGQDESFKPNISHDRCQILTGGDGQDAPGQSAQPQPHKLRGLTPSLRLPQTDPQGESLTARLSNTRTCGSTPPPSICQIPAKLNSPSPLPSPVWCLA